MTDRRVAASLVAYPPVRLVGSELCTHDWLLAAARRGWQVGAHVVCDEVAGGGWEHEGVPVRPAGELWDSPRDGLLVAHADFSHEVRSLRAHGGHRGPIVLIAHNERADVVDGIRLTMPDLVIATSRATAEVLAGLVPWQRVRVVTPPAPEPVAPLGHPDGLVVQINVCHEKGGATLAGMARALPHRRFLAVAGGYGSPVAELAGLPNVEIVSRVERERMDELVWSRAAVLVAPSRYESWSMSASEAVSRGVPVLCSTAPGLVENVGREPAPMPWDEPGPWIGALDAMLDPRLYADAVRAQQTHAAWRPGAERFVEVIEEELDL